MILRHLYLNFFLSLTFTLGIIPSSFSLSSINSFKQNHQTAKQAEKAKAKWERQRINATIIDKSGQLYEGQILYVNDSIVYQYLSREAYNSDKLLNSTIRFSINDIDQINVYRKGQTLRGLKNALIFGGAGTLALTFITEESAWGRLWNLFGATVWVMPVSTLTGIVIGSGKKIDVQINMNEIDSFNTDLLMGINKYALFPDNSPPGLFAQDSIKGFFLTDSIYSTSQNRTEKYDSYVSKNNKEYKSPFYVSKFHFNVGVVLSANYRNKVLINDMNKLGFYEGAINDPILNDLKLDIGFSYRIKNHLRVGLTFHPKSYWTEGYYKQLLGNNLFLVSDVYSYGSSTVLGLDYVFKPVNRLMNHRIEMLIGMGISYNSLNVNNSISIAELKESSSLFYELNNSIHNENILGIKTQLQLDYYFTQNFSLYLKTAGFFLPNVDIPDINVYSDYLKTGGALKAHQTNISTIEISIGLHVHF